MKNVLITGAAGNLGTAVVNKFFIGAMERHRYCRSETQQQHAQTWREDAHCRSTNEAGVNQVIAKIIGENGTIDAALLLVGGFAAGNIDTTDGAALRSQMSLNFETAYFTARPVFQQMVKQNGGRIVLVASKTALLSHVGKDYVAYSLSKFLLTKLAELLNAEGNPKNVVCSVIAPSTIDTEMNRQSMPKADSQNGLRLQTSLKACFFSFLTRENILREPVFKVYGGLIVHF
ncbi:MAG: SDR family NAD(P)-dependent oxidoreductase [Bacteroidota bacterium]